MSDVAMIPIHLEGLFLEHDTLVTESHTNFSALPYSMERDYNPDNANISVSILSSPFQNQNLNLKKGMHLHWALPDGLTHDGEDGKYLAVPNRWLVTRIKNDGIEQQWIVESDFLYPDEDTSQEKQNSIVYPIDTLKSEKGFKHMGRHFPLESWEEITKETDTYLGKLTAVGYGEPSFAAFYPNCHSVFGFFDEAVDTKEKLEGLRYQLVGWYSDSSLDPFLSVVKANSKKPSEDIKKAIKEAFEWDIDVDTKEFVGMCCYADLEFKPESKQGKITIHNAVKNKAVKIAIGNTGTEALSAFLAKDINGDKEKIEAQLENLFLLSGLENKKLDLDARFKSARHEKEFNPVGGGAIWEIKSKKEDLESHQNKESSPTHIQLPPSMIDVLDDLNRTQQKYEQLGWELDDLRHVLFSDWYKYMLTTYPGTNQDYLDIDFVKWFITSQGFTKIEAVEDRWKAEKENVEIAWSVLMPQIEAFNAGEIENTVIWELINSKPIKAGLVINGTKNWELNEPFSEKCLQLNGDDNYITGNGGMQIHFNLERGKSL